MYLTNGRRAQNVTVFLLVLDLILGVALTPFLGGLARAGFIAPPSQAAAVGATQQEEEELKHVKAAVSKAASALRARRLADNLRAHRRSESTPRFAVADLLPRRIARDDTAPRGPPLPFAPLRAPPFS